VPDKRVIQSDPANTKQRLCNSI